MGAGVLLLLMGTVLLLVAAFREHVLWGLAGLLLPFAIVVFAFRHWDDAKQPFLVFVSGFAVLFTGSLVWG